MDVAYCGALICGALGTVAAVFMSLAVNECGSDAGVMVLVRKVGSFRVCVWTPCMGMRASVIVLGIAHRLSPQAGLVGGACFDVWSNACSDAAPPQVGVLLHCPYYLFSLSVIFFAFGVWYAPPGC
jgi:hypothetical protein